MSPSLEGVSSRAVLVIRRALLEKHEPAACAAHFGISKDAFVALLARSLDELPEGRPGCEAPATHPELTWICRELRALPKESHHHSPPELEEWARWFWNLPPPPAPTLAPAVEPAWPDWLRRLLLLALAGGALYALSRA